MPRARDDIRHSTTNLARDVKTPIKLPSWRRTSETPRPRANTEYDWAFSKSYYGAAYRQHSLCWEKRSRDSMALHTPSDGRMYGFMSRTVMFGSIAAALRGNVLSRILSEIVGRIFGIHRLRYFDDFRARIPDSIDDLGITFGDRRCEILGIFAKYRNPQAALKSTPSVFGGDPLGFGAAQRRVSLT